MCLSLSLLRGRDSHWAASWWGGTTAKKDDGREQAGATDIAGPATSRLQDLAAVPCARCRV